MRPAYLTTIVATLAALTACSSRITEAERRYELIKKGGASAEEICARGRDVVAAYIDAGDVEAYRQARVRMSIECLAAGFGTIVTQ